MKRLFFFLVLLVGVVLPTVFACSESELTDQTKSGSFSSECFAKGLESNQLSSEQIKSTLNTNPALFSDLGFTQQKDALNKYPEFASSAEGFQIIDGIVKNNGIAILEEKEVLNVYLSKASGGILSSKSRGTIQTIDVSGLITTTGGNSMSLNQMTDLEKVEIQDDGSFLITAKEGGGPLTTQSFTANGKVEFKEGKWTSNKGFEFGVPNGGKSTISGREGFLASFYVENNVMIVEGGTLVKGKGIANLGIDTDGRVVYKVGEDYFTTDNPYEEFEVSGGNDFIKVRSSKKIYKFSSLGEINTLEKTADYFEPIDDKVKTEVFINRLADTKTLVSGHYSDISRGLVYEISPSDPFGNFQFEGSCSQRNPVDACIEDIEGNKLASTAYKIYPGESENSKVNIKASSENSVAYYKIERENEDKKGTITLTGEKVRPGRGSQNPVLTFAPEGISKEGPNFNSGYIFEVDSIDSSKKGQFNRELIQGSRSYFFSFDVNTERAFTDSVSQQLLDPEIFRNTMSERERNEQLTGILINAYGEFERNNDNKKNIDEIPDGISGGLVLDSPARVSPNADTIEDLPIVSQTREIKSFDANGKSYVYTVVKRDGGEELFCYKDTYCYTEKGERVSQDGTNFITTDHNEVPRSQNTPVPTNVARSSVIGVEEQSSAFTVQIGTEVKSEVKSAQVYPSLEFPVSLSDKFNSVLINGKYQLVDTSEVTVRYGIGLDGPIEYISANNPDPNKEEKIILQKKMLSNGETPVWMKAEGIGEQYFENAFYDTEGEAIIAGENSIPPEEHVQLSKVTEAQLTVNNLNVVGQDDKTLKATSEIQEILDFRGELFAKRNFHSEDDRANALQLEVERAQILMELKEDIRIGKSEDDLREKIKTTRLESEEIKNENLKEILKSTADDAEEIVNNLYNKEESSSSFWSFFSSSSSSSQDSSFQRDEDLIPR